MAKFNDKIIVDSAETRKNCSAYLQSCLDAVELENLKRWWILSDSSLPWWKFALDNISVSARSKDNRDADILCAKCGAANFADYESTQREMCSVYLQSCLDAVELENLKQRWISSTSSLPWWKFAFDNILVSVHSENYSGMDILCPKCGAFIIADYGSAQCEVCGWSAAGEELKKYI